MKNLDEALKKMFQKIGSDVGETLSQLLDQEERINNCENELKSINEKIDAIIECIRGDRKDINALINIYKAMKPQTKRKK